MLIHFCRDATHRKHLFQQFLCCCVLIRCGGNLFVCDRYLVTGLHAAIYSYITVCVKKFGLELEFCREVINSKEQSPLEANTHLEKTFSPFMEPEGSLRVSLERVESNLQYSPSPELFVTVRSMLILLQVSARLTSQGTDCLLFAPSDCLFSIFVY
jgi:hypothetical protein